MKFEELLRVLDIRLSDYLFIKFEDCSISVNDYINYDYLDIYDDQEYTSFVLIKELKTYTLIDFAEYKVISIDNECNNSYGICIHLEQE